MKHWRRHRAQTIGNGIARWLLVLVLLGFAGIARAGTVEVAPGVQVTRTTYDAPADEQPFFGFTEKTEAQRAADEELVKELVDAAGSREQAFDAMMIRGWKAITTSKTATAAKRFNQAYLLMPERSGVYHGFAMVAVNRFNDLAFADELFRVALRQPNPQKMLNTDYGRMLLMAKRYREAQPVLEQAVIDMPDFGDAFGYLAFARLQTGDRAGACAASATAFEKKPSQSVLRDMVRLRKEAQCQ